MHVNSRYAVSAGVKFRYEDFGGVVYRRQDDQLFFINSRLAITLLDSAGKGTVSEIAAALVSAALGEKQQMEAFVLKTLSSMEEWGIVYELAARNSETACPYYEK